MGAALALAGPCLLLHVGSLIGPLPHSKGCDPSPHPRSWARLLWRRPKDLPSLEASEAPASGRQCRGCRPQERDPTDPSHEPCPRGTHGPAGSESSIPLQVPAPLGSESSLLGSVSFMGEALLEWKRGAGDTRSKAAYLIYSKEGPHQLVLCHPGACKKLGEWGTGKAPHGTSHPDAL